MSRYDPHSPLSELNRSAVGEAIKPPAALWRLLALCGEHWHRTGGYFDVAQGALVELWRQSPSEPSIEAARAARLASGFSGVRLDPATQTVGFSRPGLQLDLGAVGKGVALDSVVAELKRRGVRCAFLSFGESSIAAVGSHPSGRPWPVGIASLFDPALSLHAFSLTDASLSTSGNRPDQPSSHGPTVRPMEGAPVEGCRTMSVVAATATESEILSTALLACPLERRCALLAGYPGVSAVEICYDRTQSGWIGRIAWRHDP